MPSLSLILTCSSVKPERLKGKKCWFPEYIFFMFFCMHVFVNRTDSSNCLLSLLSIFHNIRSLLFWEREKKRWWWTILFNCWWCRWYNDNIVQSGLLSIIVSHNQRHHQLTTTLLSYTIGKKDAVPGFFYSRR